MYARMHACMRVNAKRQIHLVHYALKFARSFAELSIRSLVCLDLHRARMPAQCTGSSAMSDSRRVSTLPSGRWGEGSGLSTLRETFEPERLIFHMPKWLEPELGLLRFGSWPFRRDQRLRDRIAMLFLVNVPSTKVLSCQDGEATGI